MASAVFKRGDTVTVEGRIHGAVVLQVEPSGKWPNVRVAYRCPREGTVTRWVDGKDVSK